MTAPRRALATLAVGFLLLDAVLLVWAGLDLHRRGLVWGGLICGAAAGAVSLLWRRYRRALADLDAGRREMRAEAEAIRDLLNQHHLHN